MYIFLPTSTYLVIFFSLSLFSLNYTLLQVYLVGVLVIGSLMQVACDYKRCDFLWDKSTFLIIFHDRNNFKLSKECDIHGDSSFNYPTENEIHSAIIMPQMQLSCLQITMIPHLLYNFSVEKVI